MAMLIRVLEGSIHPRLVVIIAACVLAGCGRRKVEPAWAGFFAAFGFFASRLLRLRSLPKMALLVVQTIDDNA